MYQPLGNVPGRYVSKRTFFCNKPQEGGACCVPLDRECRKSADLRDAYVHYYNSGFWQGGANRPKMVTQPQPNQFSKNILIWSTMKVVRATFSHPKPFEVCNNIPGHFNEARWLRKFVLEDCV